MTQSEKRTYLIKALLDENTSYASIEIPRDEKSQKILLRSLFNIREPRAASKEFLSVQDSYLQCEIAKKGITDISELTPIRRGIYLWQGDITTLKCDAVVNAANSRLLGCFNPCHGCIDNAIHTYSGIQLRLECAKIMKQQGHDEQTGRAKITKAYNLPSKYILHTVGPIIYGKLTQSDCDKLSSCYLSCMELAEQYGIKSIAFCCISTGEFHFPNEKAAHIAVQTVQKYQERSNIEVIFNVFKQEDCEIYSRMLG